MGIAQQKEMNNIPENRIQMGTGGGGAGYQYQERQQNVRQNILTIKPPET
jgi:hypothetical protein